MSIVEKEEEENDQVLPCKSRVRIG